MALSCSFLICALPEMAAMAVMQQWVSRHPDSAKPRACWVCFFMLAYAQQTAAGKPLLVSAAVCW
jgi:hypothetical protein